jgi:hypothetical protein
MRILIEVPTYDGRISQATSESLWRLDTRGHEVDYRPRTGYGCAMARNRIAADALNAHYDSVLMVDNDISLPQDALRNLLEHGVDICLGYYLNRYARGERKFTTLYKQGAAWDMYADDELRELRERGERLIRVKGGGFGCALVRTEVFAQLEFPWFEWTDLSRDVLDAEDAYACHDAFRSGGEDINFCNAATNAGIPIHADTRVACGHEFREVVWPK